MITPNARADQEVTRVPFDTAAEKGWVTPEVHLYALSEPMSGQGDEFATHFVASKSGGKGPGAVALYATHPDGTLLPGPYDGLYPPVPLGTADETHEIAEVLAAVGFRDVTTEA